MRICFSLLSTPMSFEQASVNTLVIENRTLFRKTVSQFEDNSYEESFIFSKDYTPFEFEKHGLYISNPILPEITNKKLLTKINTYLEKIACDEYSELLNEIKGNLTLLGQKLSRECDFDFEFNDDIDNTSIIKILDFKINNGIDNPAALLVRFMILISKYLKLSLFVVPNMHLYFEEIELAEIYRTLSLNEIKLLCIDQICGEKALDSEKYHIIDKDLCCIDNVDSF